MPPGKAKAAGMEECDPAFPTGGLPYRVRYSPAHRWFYVPEMRADEAVLIKCYGFGRGRDGRTARFTAHPAFEDPAAPADVLPREGIELRTLVFHNA